MRYAAIPALVALCFVVFPVRGWAQVHIPGPGEGYQITKADSSQAAPSGFEGRTDTSTLTAVGNTPATTGKRIVARFTLGNQIKTCPAADGTAEGKGQFSMTVDSTDAQANGTSTLHMEMRADAKYKGQVGDDAFLHGPVNAEIDYTYNQSGSLRDKSGAIATSPGSNVQQHVTIPILVAKAFNPPSLGAFAGGDPTQGHYAEAFGAGTALTYWGGIYYSVAETKWLQGQCVQVVFNPPTNTLQPVLGGQTTVSAEVKTKGGESVKARFQDAHALGGGGVSPGVGPSDVGAPMKFTYRAPNQKVESAGFGVNGISRAGIAEGEWKTGLGTGWSGEITATRETTGDEGHDDLQTWSTYIVTRITIQVKDGVGTATGYGEVKIIAINRRKAVRGGAIVTLDDNSSTTEGTGEGSSHATVDVLISKTNGTYSIKPGYLITTTAKAHAVTCNSTNGCREDDAPLPVQADLPGELGGKLSDPNHLQGSQSDTRSNLGRSHKGVQTYTLTWDLARQGSSQ